MFKMKAKKDTVDLLKDSMQQGINWGIKQAEDQIVHLNRYISKNHCLTHMKKHPQGGVLMLAGLGLAAFGLMNLFKK